MSRFSPVQVSALRAAQDLQVVAPSIPWQPAVRTEDAEPDLPRFQGVLVPCGSVRCFPRLMARPVISDGGDASKLVTVLKTFGRGPVQVSNLRLGDEVLVVGRLNNGDPVTVESANWGKFSWELREGRLTDDGLTLFPLTLESLSLYARLPKTGGYSTSDFTVQNTKAGTTQVNLTFRFPAGLAKKTTVGGQAVFTPISLQIHVYKRLSGTSTWVAVTKVPVKGVPNADAFEKTFQGLVIGKGAGGTYSIGCRIYGVSPAAENPDVRWTVLTSRGPKSLGATLGYSALVLQGDLAVLGNDQFLNGLNADVDVELKETVGGAAVKTRSPAAAWLDVLQGKGNPRPLPNSRIDSTTIAAWKAECDTAGYAFDFVFGRDGGQGSIREALNLAAAAGRARAVIRDGLYSVIREPSGSPVWLYTPANMRPGFRRLRTFDGALHGIRCTFENRATGFKSESFIVYAQGFSASNASKFEGWTFDGTTSKPLVIDLATYHLSILQARGKAFEFPVDIEHLRGTRGDLCRVAHYRIRRGTSWGRVVAVPSSTRLRVSRPCTMVTGGAYGVRVLNADGTQVVTPVVTAPGEGLDLVTTGAHGASEGDVFAFGNVNAESLSCVILRVTHGEDLSAVLTVAPA